MHGSGSNSTPICLLSAGWLSCHLLLRSRCLCSFQCTAGFPGAAASCLITPFLLLVSHLLAGCCMDASASCTLKSASLPSLAPPLLSPPLSMPQPLLASSNVQRTLPAVWLLFSDTYTSTPASCPPQLLVVMPLATLLPLVVPKNSTVYPLLLAKQQKIVANGVWRAIHIPNPRWWVRVFVRDTFGRYLLIVIILVLFLLFFWLVEATTTSIKNCS